MTPCRSLAVLAIFLVHPGTLHAQAPAEGTVTGILVDQSTHAPLESVGVVLRSRADSTRVLGTTTLKDGTFVIAHVPLGAYVVKCSLVGHTSFRSPEFQLSPTSLRMDLGTVSLKPAVLVLDEISRPELASSAS